MTLVEILKISDAQTAMCELSVSLAKKAARQQTLSPPEQAINDIMWLDTQICLNGFDGWLYYTKSERIVRTVDALSTVGCSRVADTVASTLSFVRFDPRVATDRAREALLDSLSDELRQGLSRFDSEYYDAAEDCMVAYRDFVVSHQSEFCVDEPVS